MEGGRSQIVPGFGAQGFGVSAVCWRAFGGALWRKSGLRFAAEGSVLCLGKYFRRAVEPKT